MKIACMKCQKMIANVIVYDDANVAGRTIIEVHCHGEKDSMHIDESWAIQNQDFIFMINHNMTIGQAFAEDKEYEKLE